MNPKKTVIKNTLYMFLRMFFVMFITLFSTRILLNELGFVDYGIYDLIFGIVILFNIFSGSMATSLQRFYNVTHGDLVKQSYIYSISLQVFFGASLFVLLLGYSLSSTVVNNLNIPINRAYEAIIFFQLCIVNLVLMIFRLPFISLLISNEKMGLYASISIFDSVLKFGGVLLLGYISFYISNLIAYGYILVFITFFVTLIYIYLCYKKLQMPKIQKVVSYLEYKEILSFSGWTLFGSSSSLISQQGSSIILNKFFGVLVNAANAVSMQVYTAVYQFVNSFQTAYSPYLMKTYAQADLKKLQQLIVFFSKFSVFLYLIVAIPIFTFAEPILKFWLVNPPDFSVFFTRIILVVIFFEVLSTPLWLTVQASGSIQRYQLIISTILISTLPIAYIFILIYEIPIIVFLVKIIISILAYLYRIYFVCSLGCLEFKKYFLELLSRIICLLFIVSPIIYVYASRDFDILGILLHSLLIVFLLIIISCITLLSRSEYQYILMLSNKFLKRD